MAAGLIVGGIAVGKIIAKAKLGLSLVEELIALSKGDEFDFKRLLKIAVALGMVKGLEQALDPDLLDDFEDIKSKMGEPRYHIHWFLTSDWVESTKFIPLEEDTDMGIMVITFKEHVNKYPVTVNRVYWEDFVAFATAPSAGKYYLKHLAAHTSPFIEGFSLDVGKYLPKELTQPYGAVKKAQGVSKNPTGLIKAKVKSWTPKINKGGIKYGK